MKKSLILVLMAMFTVVCLGTVASAAWAPKSEIEFIVPSSPGGGSDLNARTIADIAQKEKLSPVNLVVINKPGGSGAVSFAYVGAKKGDTETMMVLHSGQDLGSYVLNWDVKGKDLTYLGTVAFDDLIVCALKGSDYTDIKSAIEASKQKRVTYGGAQKGNGDHSSFLMLNKYTGAKFKYVMFNSSGEVTSAMLGKHVNLGVFNPSEAIGQVRAGNLIPLATFSTKRLSGEFADVPTFGELGYKGLEIAEVRAISGPADMSAESVAFYEKLLEDITKTEAWTKNYIEKNFLTPVYMDAEETKNYFLKTSKEALERFKEDGLVK